MEISEVMIIEELESIKRNAEELIGKDEKNLRGGQHGDKLVHTALCQQVDEIIKEYNLVVSSINKIFENIGVGEKLNILSEIKPKWNEVKKGTFNLVDVKLRAVSLRSGRALSILKNMATSSRDIKNRFDELKKEISDLKKEGVEEKAIKNLNTALIEFESNHLISTVLICGRIGVFYLDTIPGMNILEKVKELTEKKILNVRGAKDNLIKANKGVRDVFAHDLNYSPTASQILSIFGDTIEIVKIVNSYKKITNPSKEGGFGPVIVKAIESSIKSQKEKSKKDLPKNPKQDN